MQNKNSSYQNIGGGRGGKGKGQHHSFHSGGKHNGYFGVWMEKKRATQQHLNPNVDLIRDSLGISLKKDM